MAVLSTFFRAFGQTCFQVFRVAVFRAFLVSRFQVFVISGFQGFGVVPQEQSHSWVRKEECSVFFPASLILNSLPYYFSKSKSVPAFLTCSIPAWVICCKKIVLSTSSDNLIASRGSPLE